MIYLLRKSLSQQPCSQFCPWCPVGQLEQPLIQGTTPNYATRELKHTQHRPAAVIHISVTESLLLVCFAFLSTSACFNSLSHRPSPAVPAALWASQAVWLLCHCRMVTAMLR